MDKKRVAAIIGLVCMALCVLCIVISGAVPAYKDLLWAFGMVAFLVAVSILVIINLRKGPAASPADEEEKEAEEK